MPFNFLQFLVQSRYLLSIALEVAINSCDQSSLYCVLLCYGVHYLFLPLLDVMHPLFEQIFVGVYLLGFLLFLGKTAESVRAKDRKRSAEVCASRHSLRRMPATAHIPSDPV